MPATDSPSTAHHDGNAAAYRVLLAEDDADNREMYEAGLLSQGFTVRAFADGVRAFEAAFQSPPDIVVTDLALRGIDGFQLCRRLRETERTRAVPTIILTGREAKDLKSGEPAPSYADLYLVKPCDPNRLGVEIRTIIARSRQLRERTVAVRERASESAVRAAAVQSRSRAVWAKWRQRISSEEATRRIRADFLEMPGLRVTLDQGTRLWNLDKQDCAGLLDQLVELGFLGLTDGRYFRR